LLTHQENRGYQAADRYDIGSRLLHWVTFALLVAQFLLGWFMPGTHSSAPPVGLQIWHIGVGTALLLLVIVRLAWAIFRSSPPPVDQSWFLQRASRFAHMFLYILLVAVPVLGWLNANGRTWNVKLAGIFTLPSIATHGSAGAAVGEWHTTSAYVLLILIGIHVGAALLHQFGHKDGILRRML
jgi:cytochrome b561